MTAETYLLLKAIIILGGMGSVVLMLDWLDKRYRLLPHVRRRREEVDSLIEKHTPAGMRVKRQDDGT